MIAVAYELGAVVVSCSGEKKASDFLKKYCSVDDFLLRKEEDGKIYLYIAQIHDRYSGFPTEMLRELISLPDSTQKKKSIRDKSDEQDKCGALGLTDNTDSACDIIQYGLSCVWRILISDVKRQEMETLIGVLFFVTSPRGIIISGEGLATDPVLVETFLILTLQIDLIGWNFSISIWQPSLLLSSPHLSTKLLTRLMSTCHLTLLVKE